MAKESLILDLGCGGNLYPGAIGVDLKTHPLTAATVYCNLGFDPLPFDDDAAKLVVCRHIIEHIPDCVWERVITFTPQDDRDPEIDERWVRHQPTVYLFNEIYRVLQPGGELYIEIPLTPYIPAYQDPTHVSFWNLEKFNYFSGDYYGFHDVYSHASRFEKLECRTHPQHDWLGIVRLRAIKGLPTNYPYVLNYDIERENGAL